MESTAPALGADPAEYAGCVVVGVDGSEHANRALVWAARQAAVENRPLVAVHGVRGPHGTFPQWWALDALEDVVLGAARGVVEEAERLVHEVSPRVTVRPRVVDEDPRDLLVAASERAHLVVVGSHGRSSWRRMTLGSVSASVTQHARCPVVVLGQQPTRPGESVLVGADGLAESVPVIEFAFRHASQHGVPLTVMHAFWDVAGEQLRGRRVGEDEPGLEDLRLLLSESVAGLREKFPDVVVELQLARGLVDLCLTEATPVRDLVVVGRRDPARWSRLLYGSATTAVLDRARSPVAVVPEAGRRPAAPTRSRELTP